MTFFFDRYTKPFLERSDRVRILEIGASEGRHTDLLLSLSAAQLTLIDPCIDRDLESQYADEPRVTVIKDISLQALPHLNGEFDAIMIDGDHNWYTVLNELRHIEEHRLLAKDGVIFFHDVEWPYGRRDMYYQPELIPSDDRQPNAQMGIVKGQSELSSESDFNAELYNAREEGGPKNGVLTAIEDFVKSSDGEYSVFTVQEENGLGVLVRSSDRQANLAFDQLVAYRKSKLRKSALRSRFPWLYKVAKRLTGR